MTDFRIFTGLGLRLPEDTAGDAFLVHRGTVVGRGTTATVGRMLPPGVACPIVRSDGYIIPGLRDSHIHPVAYTALLTGSPLHRARSLDEVKTILRTAAAQTSGLITGSNLNEATLAETRLPVASDLDEVAVDRPVMVHRYDGHMAIVNSKALAMANITAATPDPAGGIIDRDQTGAPTGVLRETAIDLVATAPGIERRVEADDVAKHLRRLAGLGITSIGAMVRTGEGPWAHIGDEAETLVAAAPDIPIRVHAFVTADTPEALDRAAKSIEAANGMVEWAGVKRFADGSFGSLTAAMFEPFADAPDRSGTMRLNDADIAMAHQAVAAGRAVAIHAIGDAAAARVLDLFDHLAAEGVDGSRLRIEHASILSERDMERFGRLGAVASVQPAFLGSETGWIESRLGPERLTRTYAYASLIRAGVIVAGGSDSPVEAPDPWEAMALCRDRAGLGLAEALTPEQALALYTTNAAAALGEPEPLAAGSPADFAVVDRDPFQCTPDELRETRVMATYVDGQRVEVDMNVKWWID